MRLFVSHVAVALLALLLPLSTHAQSTGAEVKLKLSSTTTITGTVVMNAQAQKVNAFRGIRYAEAPTGENRWKPSKLLKPSGAINATAFGNTCHASPEPGSVLYPESEDCLFLNVYAPASATANSKLPVMVWTHGGTWIRGNSNMYDGRNIVGAAGNDVIYVSFNYRLGLFGFLANQQLLKEGNGANAALRDMTNAYQWVRDNIRAFGGNPKDITAFGESSGAFMIALQMVTNNGNQKIFDKAILESGGYPTFSQVMSIAEQEAMVGEIASKVGCADPDAATVLACLRTKDARALMDAGGSLMWRPIVDGKFLTDLPYKLVVSNKVSKIPTILGTNTHEGFPFAMRVTVDEAVIPTARAMFPFLTSDDLATLATLYPPGVFLSATHRASEILGDLVFVCPSEKLSETLAQCESTYHYRFNQSDMALGIDVAYHSAEIKYIFNGNPALPADLVANMQKFWTNFARFGSPNGPKGAKSVWPRFDNRSKQQIVLQKGPLKTEKNGAYMPSHAERCAFWTKIEARVAATSLYKRAPLMVEAEAF